MHNNVISLVYYITAVICIVLFVYMLTENSLSKEKRVITAVAFTTMICSFSDSQFLISDNRFLAVLYSAITVSSFLFSCVSLLYFVILNIYSELNKKLELLLKSLYTISILYLPVFFIFYINRHKNVSLPEFKEYLWNISKEPSLVKIMIFPIAGIIFLISLKIILKCRERDFLINIKKKMDYYSTAIMILISGVIIDVSMTVFYTGLKLHILPLIITVLTAYQIILYAGERHFVSKREYSHNVYIVDSVLKKGIYCSVSGIIGIISAIFYGVELLFNSHFAIKNAIYTLISIAISILVVFIQTKVKREVVSDALSNILWAMLIPIIVDSFTESSAVTVWTMVVVFMLISCIFISKRFIVLFGLTGLASFIIMAINNPKSIILFTTQDHLFRILIFLIITAIIITIHSIFVRRLYEINKQEFFQMAVVNISKGLIASVDKDIDARLNESLSDIMNFTDSDRVFVYRFSEDKSLLNLLHFSEKDKSCHVSLEPQINSYDLSEKFRFLVKDNIILFDQSVIQEYQYLRLNSKSSIYIPMKDKDRVIGMLVLQSLKAGHYKNFDKKLLRLLSDMLSNALISNENDKLLVHNSVYDTLTQLRNRSSFTEILNYRIGRAAEDQQITIVFIDLDSFKEINDLLGHDFGDKILVEVSKRFIELIGKDAVISRFGGDEFLLMFNDLDSREEIGNKLNAIMSAFVNPVMVGKNEVHITMSCGIAIYPQDGNDAVTLISNADIAMNQAKQEGKNRYVFCSESMKGKIKRRAILTDSLRKALDNSEFKVVYQPQVDAKTHKIRAAEALLRWTPKDSDEIGNFVSPGEFIPILEETGMILDVGRFVMEESIKMLSTLSQMGVNSFMIAVNMSTMQFKDLSFVNFIDEKLKKYDVRPDQIDVEVTEGAYGDEYTNVSFLLGELQTLGAKVSIDDFGTGYSNMSRLSHISIDKIKIDISFVRGIGINFKDEGIIKTIIKLSQSLDCVTLAEGVETEEQLEFLKDNGCQLIQGYYFYKPLSSDEFLSLITEKFKIK